MSRQSPIVADIGPLIHLSEANSLSLLDRFDTLLVPEVVFEELQAGGVPAAFDSLDHERRRVNVPEGQWPELDPGETAALALSDRAGGVLLAYTDGHLNGNEAKDQVRALEREGRV